jgi:hypothetical protein
MRLINNTDLQREVFTRPSLGGTSRQRSYQVG